MKSKFQTQLLHKLGGCPSGPLPFPPKSLSFKHRNYFIFDQWTYSIIISESQVYIVSHFSFSHELKYCFGQAGCCLIDRCCAGSHSPSPPTSGLTTALASTQMHSTGTNKYKKVLISEWLGKCIFLQDRRPTVLCEVQPWMLLWCYCSFLLQVLLFLWHVNFRTKMCCF